MNWCCRWLWINCDERLCFNVVMFEMFVFEMMQNNPHFSSMTKGGEWYQNGINFFTN